MSFMSSGFGVMGTYSIRGFNCFFKCLVTISQKVQSVSVSRQTIKDIPKEDRIQWRKAQKDLKRDADGSGNSDLVKQNM